MNQSLSFVFKGHNANVLNGKAEFDYEIIKDGKNLNFVEKIYFPPSTSRVPQEILKSILDNLMLILGISYWKTYCPKEIIVESKFLNKEQANFWNTVYTKGLGEFFYKNKIDFRGLINFPYVLSTPVKQASSSFQSSAPRKDRGLLGLGGGKDSIVAGELLKVKNKPFDVFTIGTSLVQREVANALNKKPIIIKRELDSKLFDLNKTSGVYNGHIPISAIYAFLGLFAASVYDYSSIVVGNEKSANYGNIEYLGEMINHQWSKSEEFEKLFQQYIQKFITPDVSYHSILRNMNELEVTEEFVKYPKYFKIFSSCNSNFKIRNLHLGGVVKRHLRGDRLAPRSLGEAGMGSSEVWRIWCCKCAKCLFVFTLLSAFISKQEVLDIFGKNLFDDKSLLTLFKELLGIKNFKPFECVGTPEEVKEALSKIAQKKEFNKDFLVSYFLKNKS